MKRWIAVFAVSVVALYVALLSPSLAKTQAHPHQWVPGELVVKLKSGKSNTSFEQLARNLQPLLPEKSIVSVRHFVTSDRFAVFHLSESDLKSALEILNHHADVAYAEPNFLYHTQVAPSISSSSEPSDAQFSALWGMKNTGQTDAAGQVGKIGSDIHVSEVWDAGMTGSKSIKVAVIDTGIDYQHPDLVENIWTGADGSHGWNAIDNTNNPMDDNNHGTHCAGTIGATGNNGIGVAGVNWKVSMMPVKFLDSNGSGSLDHAVQAIQFATNQRVQIMSNSWGGGNYSQALFDAIHDARDAGILFVAAAANSGSDNDVSPSYPASYQLDNILSVAATDNRDHLAKFSNYGKTTVHVAAPGVKILSTEKGGTYGIMSGTSMATPHVAGIAALLLSLNPSYTYSQLKDLLIRTSDKVRGLTQKVVSKGRVNVYNAIHGIVPADLPEPQGEWKEVPVSVESVHPYENSKHYAFPITVPGAKYIKIYFENVDVEPGFDHVVVQSTDGDTIDTLTGKQPAYTTGYIEGSSALVTLDSDDSLPGYGFKITKAFAIY